MIQIYLLICGKSLPYLMVFLPMIGDPFSYPGGFPFSSQDLLCNCRTSLSTSSSTGWYFERLSLSWSSRFLFLFQHFLHQRQTIIHSINSMMVEIEMITVRPTEPSIPENIQILKILNIQVYTFLVLYTSKVKKFKNTTIKMS